MLPLMIASPLLAMMVQPPPVGPGISSTPPTPMLMVV